MLFFHQIPAQTSSSEGCLPWSPCPVNFTYDSCSISILLLQHCTTYLIIIALMSVSPTWLLRLWKHRAIVFCSPLYPQCLAMTNSYEVLNNFFFKWMKIIEKRLSGKTLNFTFISLNFYLHRTIIAILLLLGLFQAPRLLNSSLHM